MARILAMMVLLCVSTQTAHADLWVRFEEAAPKDRITIENRSGCPLSPFTLRIDLGGSLGKLVFDTTPGGLGANVAQPFEIEQGAGLILNDPQVFDGDTAVEIAFLGLKDKAQVILTADLDDQLTGGAQTIVDGAEITGALVLMSQPGQQIPPARFRPDATAVVPLKDCFVS